MPEPDSLTLATRQHFAKLYRRVIADAESGAIRVNNLSEYLSYWSRAADSVEAGEYDQTFTFHQYREFLATGESRPLLP